MQYPVPQFTDVEDRIIGSLTMIQFGILFGTGILVFLVYAGTKNIPVTVFLLLALGVPALCIAFVHLNGRPLYRSFGAVARFFTSARYMVFYKEVYGLAGSSSVRDVDFEGKKTEEPKEHKETTQARLSAINRILEQQAAAESEIVGAGKAVTPK